MALYSILKLSIGGFSLIIWFKTQNINMNPNISIEDAARLADGLDGI